MAAIKLLVSLMIALVLLAQPYQAANILGYMVTSSRSHFIIQDSVMQGLAAKGHNVRL